MATFSIDFIIIIVVLIRAYGRFKKGRVWCFWSINTIDSYTKHSERNILHAGCRCIGHAFQIINHDDGYREIAFEKILIGEQAEGTCISRKLARHDQGINAMMVI